MSDFLQNTSRSYVYEAVEWDQQDLEMKNEETEMTMMNVIDRGENATATVTTETKTGAVAGRGVVRLRLVEAGVVDVVVLAHDDVDEKCQTSSGLFFKTSGNSERDRKLSHICRIIIDVFNRKFIFRGYIQLLF